MLNTILAIICWYFVECGGCFMLLIEFMMATNDSKAKNVSFFKALCARFDGSNALEIVMLIAGWPYFAIKFVVDVIRILRLAKANKNNGIGTEQQD